MISIWGAAHPDLSLGAWKLTIQLQLREKVAEFVNNYIRNALYNENTKSYEFESQRLVDNYTLCYHDEMAFLQSNE